MENLKVELKEGKSFSTRVRGHDIVTDLPVEQGGKDAAPTPPELFVASIGACMGVYALSYLKTAGMDPGGLSIDLDWELDSNKTSIKRIKVAISAPSAELGERRSAFIAAAKKCLLHNTLSAVPEVVTVLSED